MGLLNQNGSGVVFQDATVRQTLHLSLGTSNYLRLRFSNAFGVSTLPLTSVTIARPPPGVNGSAGSSAIDTSTVQTVKFSGNESIDIPDMGLAVSDPIEFPVDAQSVISVSAYLATGQTTNYVTGHPGSRTTSWFASGNHVSDGNLTVTDPNSQSALHWYFVSAVEAWEPLEDTGFAIVGDSITDGRGSDNNANNRWPDLLLARMQSNTTVPITKSISVNNQAAGGNRILADGLGPNALSRIDRDVLSQSGIRYAMIFEGVNDIGVASADPASQAAIGDDLIQAYEQIISRVHAMEIPIFAATITPFSAPSNTTIQPYSDPERERTRQRINNWITTSGRFDAVVDFASIVADPNIPTQLDPRYNSGDYLHPNVAGYQKIADEFPLEIFEQFAGGLILGRSDHEWQYLLDEQGPPITIHTSATKTPVRLEEGIGQYRPGPQSVGFNEDFATRGHRRPITVTTIYPDRADWHLEDGKLGIGHLSRSTVLCKFKHDNKLIVKSKGQDIKIAYVAMDVLDFLTITRLVVPCMES
ncbi:MAG: hypothetical protein Q9227_001699 [Pyrenula ochraceoflavens]